MRTQARHNAGGRASRRRAGLLAAATAVPMLAQLALHAILPGQHASWSWVVAVLAALVSGVLVVYFETARLRAPGSQH